MSSSIEIIKDTVTFTAVIRNDELKNRLPTKYVIEQESTNRIFSVETTDFQYALQCFLNRVT